jgi:hypothetical protein
LKISRDQTNQGDIRGVPMNHHGKWPVAAEVAHFQQYYIWCSRIQRARDRRTSLSELDDGLDRKLIGFTGQGQHVTSQMRIGYE